MSAEFVVQIINQALWTAFWICAPLLAIGFVASLLINLVQIFTSLQDTAFSTVPRLAAFLFGFVFLLPWMLKKISTYTIYILSDLGRYAH
jgi:flagellar biosynthetic protein FliQ